MDFVDQNRLKHKPPCAVSTIKSHPLRGTKHNLQALPELITPKGPLNSLPTSNLLRMGDSTLMPLPLSGDILAPPPVLLA